MGRFVISRYRPTTVVGLVYASTAVVWAAYSLLIVALPFRFQSLGLSVVQYGIAIAIFALGMLITESVWGVLAFRIGNLRTVLGLGIAVAVVYLAIGLSTTFLTLAVSLGFLGALSIFPVPLFRWMAMIAGGPGTGGAGTGRYGLFFGGGMAVGAALGPLLFVEVGFLSLTLVVLAIYAVGLGLMAWLPWRETRLPRAEPGSLSQVRRVLTAPFVFVASLVVLAFLAYTLIISFLQIYSVSAFQGTPTDSGYVIGIARATILMAGFLLGGVADRFGPMRTVPFGFLLLALGAFGTLFSSSYAEMVGATVVFAVGFGWLSASLLPLALGPVPLPLQGTAVGVFGSFEDFGLLVGPVLISAVYVAYGVRSIFLVVGAVALAGALLSVLLRYVDRGETRGPGTTGPFEE
ncbi:MAG: MFS transporter [Thermoplasmata archaeon]